MKIIIEQSDFHAIARAISCDWKLSRRIEDSVKVIAQHLKNEREHSVDCLMVGSIGTADASNALLKELITQILVGVEIVTERGSHVKHREVLNAVAIATKRVNDNFTDEHRKNVVKAIWQEKSDFEDFKKVRHATEVKEDIIKKGGKKKS